MERFPALDINFPAARENELREEMIRLASAPWSPQGESPVGRPHDPSWLFFHRQVVGTAPSCTVCIQRHSPGKWIVQSIVPDEGQTNPIPAEQYCAILADFDARIADPAANSVQGMSAMETSVYRLEDHFSPKAVGLLDRFCRSSNAGDLGTHPLDQAKWIDFLLCIFDEHNETSGDAFGYCLTTADWWPRNGIKKLVHEYDFAMQLLDQSGRRSN